MLVLGGFPALCYLLGWKIRDPFHPLIFVGLASYALSAHELLIAPTPALDFLPSSSYVLYLSVAILSLLGFYAGWGVSAWTDRKYAAAPAPEREWRTNNLLFFAAFCAIIAAGVFLTVGNQFSVTGYIRDWQMLYVPGAIVAAQLYVQNKRRDIRLVLLAIFAVLLIIPVYRFFDYGQRGDTLRTIAIAGMFYLALRKRPAKLTFIVCACVAILTLVTLVETRVILGRDPSKNRITALFQAIPQYLTSSSDRYSGSEEFIFGGALVQTAYDTQDFGMGRAFTTRLIARFTPKELFPNKWQYFGTSAGDEFDIVHTHTSIRVPGGAAISGAAQGFFELGWFCPLPWFLLGFFHQRLWFRAVYTPRVQFAGYLTTFNVAILYAITQDIYTCEMNMIYTMIPLWFIYRFSSRRVPHEYPNDIHASLPPLVQTS